MDFQRLTPKQTLACNLANQRINIWEGSVRSAKTISSLIRWITFVMTGPPGNLVMVGKTNRTLKRNILDVITELLPAKSWKVNEGSGEAHLYDRRIYLAGANDERAQEKIRGLTLAGAYVDEISLVPESFWTMLLSRLSVKDAKVFGTTNPEGPKHWLKMNYLDRAGTWLKHDGSVEKVTKPGTLDMARLSFHIRDNPTLSPQYVQNLTTEYTGLWRKRMIDGLWVMADGSVYDVDLEPGAGIVVGALPDFDRLWLGIDYGTTNPFVALLIGTSTEESDGIPRAYVIREWRWDSKQKRRQLTDGEYSEELREWLREMSTGEIYETWGESLESAIERIYVDPSAASFATQLHRDGWRGVKPAVNDVEDGIRGVSNLIATDRLKIHMSCTGLIGEMAAYAWDAKAAEAGNDKPVKADDHGPDALRYGLWSRRMLWQNWLTEKR